MRVTCPACGAKNAVDISIDLRETQRTGSYHEPPLDIEPCEDCDLTPSIEVARPLFDNACENADDDRASGSNAPYGHSQSLKR